MAKARAIKGLDPHASFFESAALIIRTRVEEMRAFEPYLENPEASFEHHQLRIAAKRVRYTMELFEPAYRSHTSCGPDFHAVIEAVKGLQERLGKLHDADVLVPELNCHAARLLAPTGTAGAKGMIGVHDASYPAVQGVLAVAADMQASRQKQFGKLTEDWRALGQDGFFEKLDALLDDCAAGPVPSPSASGANTNGAKPLPEPPALSVADRGGVGGGGADAP